MPKRTSQTGSELFIVDNSDEDWKVVRYLHDWCQLSKSIDIATGYFEIGSLLALKDEWQKVDQIRILMGDEVPLRTKNAFNDGLNRVTGRLDDSLEKQKETNDFLAGVPAIVDAIRSGKIRCRVYRKDKFHAKAYITHARLEVVGSSALVGSSNFTYPGLTENIELNVQITGQSVAVLQEWYEEHWANAEDVTQEILRVIVRQTRAYVPFDVYVRSLHELLRRTEITDKEWLEGKSQIYPILDQYQKDGFHELMGIANRYHGAFLCDGVGLGKTFVGLMVIEYLMERQRKRVALLVPKAVEDYKRTVRGEESQIQSLSNDYIKFLRFGEWQVQQSGVGILGLITGHGYLHGTQPRDLRHHLTVTFDRCYFLDLHGSVRRTGTEDTEDEPVFQIMTGVAIIVGLRAVKHTNEGMTALSSLTGRLEKKFAFLGKRAAFEVAASEASLYRPATPYFHFAPSETDQNVTEEYRRCLDLPEIFGTGNRQSDKEIYWATGFASQQDDLAMSFSRAELAEKMEALAASRTFDDLKEHYRLCTTDQWEYSEAKKFARRELWREHVGQVAYRPFDRRWTVLHKHILTILRKQVMSQLNGKTAHNLGLISSRAVNDLTFAHCFATNEPADKIFISSKTSTNAYVFPLFFHQNDLMGEQRKPNFSRRFLDSLAMTLHLKQTLHDIPEGLTPQDIFQYIYAVFHSPSYRSRYAEFLKIDFPRLPLTGNLELFRDLARLGGELVALHLLESPKLDKAITTYIGPGRPEVEKVFQSNPSVWLDKAQTCGFRGVSDAVWNFHVGGYQVCDKWLKDRKGRTLSKDDITHYEKIIVALSETIRLMKEIDKVIEKHGGWPGAFVTKQDSGKN